jgi:4-diphosphocytidyl-2-C-methyl-D-erythritol kinase
MLAFPNAKINLGLNITGSRADGFHDIETGIIAVNFRDILEIVPIDKNVVLFESSGLTIPGKSEDNLCLRAYYLLKENFDIPGVKIHLHKVIPMGAGLGGGSSDAAFTIRMLNELFFLNLDADGMMRYASQLGSDCAFFINNAPVVAIGKGDQFETLKPELKGYSVIIVIPSIHVSTAEAYANVEVKNPLENIRSILLSSPVAWKDRLINDFEVPVFRKHEEIKAIKEKLYSEGAVYASMSGSGSAVFGLFKSARMLKHLFHGCITWTGKLM